MNMVKDYEADNITGYNHEGPVPNIPVKRLTATSIIGDKVENAEGENLGRIDNLMVNLRTGQVEYVVLQFGSFLGMGGKLFAIPFSELTLDPSRELFILNRDKDYLKNMPGFDQAHWPDTNEHVYFADVDNYWGTTPIV
jgi:sporulation protein YlmC with PRC-barrel domain